MQHDDQFVVPDFLRSEIAAVTAANAAVDGSVWFTEGVEFQATKKRWRALLSNGTERSLLVASERDGRHSFVVEPVNSPLIDWAEVPGPVGRSKHRPWLDDLVAEVRELNCLAGVVVAIAREGQIEDVARCGIARLSPAEPLTEHSLVRWGSITKVVTALAVLKLMDSQELEIDAPAERYLSGHRLENAWTSTPLTIRHLVNHLSGLARSAPLREVMTIESAPGSERRYSNLGYNVLAQIVTEVTGCSFPDWVTENVLLPAGMASSRIETYADGLFGYDRGFGRIWQALQPTLDLGARGLTAPLVDVARLSDAVARSDVMCRPQVVGEAIHRFRGLGVLLGEIGGVPTAFHDGGIRNSWQTYFCVELRNRRAVIAVANSHPAPIESIVEAVMEREIAGSS